MAKHKCAVETCERRIGTELLMCSLHWRLVSRPTQRFVWKAYAAWRAGGSLDDLRRVQQQAVDEVAAKEKV